MIKKLIILFKIARKLALSDALKVISKFHQPPLIIKIFLNLLSISFSKNNHRSSKSTDEEKLCTSIQGMGTTFIKLGQFLSTRPDIIGEDLSSQLEKLQDRLPPFSTYEAKEIIKKNLGSKIFDSIINFGEPLAAASIAQVHKAQINDDGVIKDVAIKILRPNIKKTFNDEIDALMLLAYFVESLISKTKRLKLVEVVFLLKEITNHEMDLRFEAAAANEFAENTKNDVGFYVPKIYWNFTSEKVLTLDWIEGFSIREKDILIEKGINVIPCFYKMTYPEWAPFERSEGRPVHNDRGPEVMGETTKRVHSCWPNLGLRQVPISGPCSFSLHLQFAPKLLILLDNILPIIASTRSLSATFSHLNS